jgi:hypothetical protein
MGHASDILSLVRAGHAIGSVRRPVPDRRDRMTHTFKLERLDGTPADPPSLKTTVFAWNPGDTIPLSAGRTLQSRPHPPR